MTNKTDLICDKCHRLYYQSAIRKCPHPAVIKNIGENICISCCASCKHCVKIVGGVQCELFKPEEPKKRAKPKPMEQTRLE